MEAMEQTISIELTETQYKHIKEVMAMDKPSKTRLTSEEKSMIHHMCVNWSQMFDEDDEGLKLIESIKNKLK